MSKKRIYAPTDKMSDIICDNFRLLQVMSRFDIPLGFGDHSVEEVCQLHQVDCTTFLAVANFINEEHPLHLEKKVAEQLFISIHTVITHRRNIARKLEIHSPTLLTVYAIVNNLVDISEVKLNL